MPHGLDINPFQTNEGVALVERPMFSKHEVAYTDDHGSSPEQCSKCFYFIRSGRCWIVRGPINPEGWCKKFMINTGSS